MFDEERIVELKSISQIYKLLSRIFLIPPDTQLLKLLKEKFIPALKEDSKVQPFPEKLVNVTLQLESFFSKINDENLSESCKQLGIKWTSLFRGIQRGHSPPPPYESLYREGVLFGGSTMDVKKYYAQFSIAPAGEFSGEPPDHIGLELHFIHYLYEKEADALQKNDYSLAQNISETRKKFITEHINTWLVALQNRITSFDENGFYSYILEFTLGLLEWELK